MNVALIGYGVENQAACRYWQSKGASLTICDQNPDTEIPEGVTGNLGEGYLNNLDAFDVIVRTSGMHPAIILEKNPEVARKITTAINIFFEECQSPIIGVTGTKGKGTTSTLIHKILEAAGKKAVLAGNIGIPALDMLESANAADYTVLELSSFQLQDIRYSPSTAVCVMVVPEHLNWHADFEDYKHAKANLFRFQNSDDVAIFNALNEGSREIVAASPSTHKLTYAVAPDGQDAPPLCTVSVRGDGIFYHDQEVMKISDVALLGRHNLENVCAAIAASWDKIEGNVGAIRSVVSTFTGLEFRLQFIRELNGVIYYNDSFSTTPETAIAALRAFDQPKVVILGGSDKGIPFNQLTQAVTETGVKHVLAIGDTGPKIATLLQNRGYSNITLDGLESMSAIVQKAYELASPGDVVLLSTGCASFGMFTDYKDRGVQFNQAVQALPSAV